MEPTEHGVQDAKNLMDYWRQFGSGFLSEKELFEQLDKVVHGVDPDKAPKEVLKIVAALIRFFRGEKSQDEVDQEFGLIAPSTVREVTVMDPKDLAKKRDALLDKMLELPEGSQERRAVEDQLRALGMSRFAIKLAAEKLKDEFEQMIYRVFRGLGFQVQLAEGGTVNSADMDLGPREAIHIQGDEHPQGAEFHVMLGDPTDREGIKDANKIVVQRNDNERVVARRLMQIIEPWLPHEGPVGPETISDVPTMGPADVNKKRDALLDQMNQLPEGSPERQKIMEQLKALGSRFVVRMAEYGMHDSSLVDDIVEAVTKHYGHMDDIVDAYLPQVLDAPEHDRPYKAAQLLISGVWPSIQIGDGNLSQQEAAEMLGEWLEGAYYWDGRM